MNRNITNMSVIYENLSSHKKINGIIHISHGKGEHIGRYSWLIDRLNTDGYHVISIDHRGCLLYTSPSPRDKRQSRMPSSA